MYLYCLTQENYLGLSKKTKDKLPLAKSKTARSAARPPLLGWRCALVRILVFSFHLLSSSRRWLRGIDSGFLSEGFEVQAHSVADPLLWSSLVPFKVRTSKNSKSFHRVAKGEFNTNKTLLKEDFSTNKTLLKRRELYPVKLSLAKVCGWMGTQG